VQKVKLRYLILKFYLFHQVDGTFIPGKQGHNHPVDIGTATAAKIVSELKRRAMGNLFKPASAIVEEVRKISKRLYLLQNNIQLLTEMYLMEKLTAGPCLVSQTILHVLPTVFAKTLDLKIHETSNLNYVLTACPTTFSKQTLL
jgi:hypothetical protein